MLTIKDIIKLKELINLSAWCKLAGLNHNTIRAKTIRGTELNVKESAALSEVLRKYQIEIKKGA
ncbi:MAG: hypothetical protein ACOCZW_01315 [Bacteroidota bacterium]